MSQRDAFFTEVCRRLRNAAPEQYIEFVKEFDKLRAAVLDDIVEIPKDQLPAFQGRVQQLVHLSRIFNQVNR